MQRLIILRHASAAPQGLEPGDRARPLANIAHREMGAVSAWLDGRTPDAVLCSTALRTRQTLELLALPEARIEFCEALYLGAPDAYLAKAEARSEATVMIVGHNPTCAALTAAMAGLEAVLGRPFDGNFPPASASLAEREDGGWRAKAVLLGGSRDG